MGGPLDELYKAMYGIKPDPPREKGSLRGLSKLYGLTPPHVETSPLVDLFFNGSNKTVPAPLPANNSLFDLLLKSKHTTPPPPPTPRISRVSDVASHPLGRLRIPPPPPTAIEPGVTWCDGVVRESLQQKATITAGRVLPGIDDLTVMEGRRVNAAFVYSDLHGFTKLVASQPENRSFVFLHTFVKVATTLTQHYNGEVMDVAGDRVLSVFHRPSGNLSNEPVEDAITFALFLQKLFTKSLGPGFAGAGLGQLSLAIGIDYGQVVVGCVGIRNNKRIVFFGDPANHAAKFQEAATAGETVISLAVYSKRPGFLSATNNWEFKPKIVPGVSVAFSTTQSFSSDSPVKPR